MFENSRFRDLFYINPDKMENLYIQLTEGAEKTTLEEVSRKQTTISLKINEILLKLFNIEYSSEKEDIKKEKKQYGASLQRKFKDVISAIHEKEYKDVFYIIEKYMEHDEYIFAIGKARFTNIYTPKYDDNVLSKIEFPIKIKKHSIILLTHNSDFLYPSYEKPTICFLRNAEVSSQCKKVYMILEDKYITDEFGFRHTCITDHHFLGKIVCYKNNYFLIPYAVWGEKSIL